MPDAQDEDLIRFGKMRVADDIGRFAKRYDQFAGASDW